MKHRFEAYAEQEGHRNFTMFEHSNDYANADVQALWECWQAAYEACSDDILEAGK